MFSLRGALGVLVAFLVLTCAVARSHAQVDPSARDPFSLTPRELLAVQSPARPAGVDVEVLLTDWSYEFDAQQRKVLRLHRVFRILTQRGVEQWGSLGMEYAAWYQNKPRIRARVVHADGSEHWLNEATLIDGAPRAQEGLVYSDQREVTGPLPALRRDCVVEVLFEKAEHQPLFGAGSSFSAYFDVSTYTRMLRVRVSAPEAVPLRYKVRGGTVRVSDRRVRGRRQLEAVQRDLLPLSEYPPVTTPTTAIVPTLHFSTGKSWADVATSYAAAVDRATAGFDAGAIANGLVAESDTLPVKAQKIADYVRHQVRYTALELGERSMLPESPGQVLQRRYGDCKDLSTLMVALLRAVGVNADVALLQTGPGLDTAPQLPGVGTFDHAIVHVAVTPPLWIDPTDPYAPVGTLPFSDQDRLALIARAQTRELTRIVPAAAEANGYREVVTVDLVDNGKPAVTETTTAWGAVGAGLRARFDVPQENLKEDLKQYVVNRYGASITDVSTENVRDVSQQFVLVIRGDDAERYESGGTGGYALATPNDLYAYLPHALTEHPPVENRRDAKRNQRDPRTREPGKFPVYINSPHALEIAYQFRLPLGFRWDDLPADLTQEAHGIRVSRAADVTDGRLNVTFRIVTSTRTVEAGDVVDVQRMLQQFDENASVRVRHWHDAAQMVEEGKLTEGLALYRDMMTRTPAEPHPGRRYANTLLNLRLGTDARAQINQVAVRHPTSADAQGTLAYIHLFDLLGRDSSSREDFAIAARAYRKAMELEPDEASWRKALALVLKTQYLYGSSRSPALVEEGLGLLAQLREEFGDHGHDQEILIQRFMVGQYDEVIAFAPEVDASANQRDTLWVASVAAVQGRGAADRKAIELAPGDPTTLLKSAVNMLIAFRQYAVAADLLELARLKNNGDPQRRMREEVQRTLAADRCDEQHPPEARSLYRLLRRLWRGELSAADAVKETRAKARGSYMDERSVRDIARAHVPATAATALTNLMLSDIHPCNERIEVEAAGDVVRVRRFDRSTNNRVGSYLLSRSGREHVLLGASGRYVLSARLIADALKHHREADARKLLSWVREDMKDRRVVANRYEYADALSALMPADAQQATSEEVALVAAALGVSNPNGPSEQRALTAALAAQTDPGRKLALTYLLSDLARMRGDVRTVDLTRAAHALRPADLVLWERAIRARLEHHAYDGIDDEIAGLAAADESRGWIMGAYLEIDRAQWEALRQRVRTRSEQNKATAEELNLVAWRMWERRAQLDLAIEYAEASVRLEEDYSNLHTLATLLAEAGRYDDAHRELDKIYQRNKDARGAWDLYTLGRIAEGYGFPNSARYIYEQIDREVQETPQSAWSQARDRLAHIRPSR